MRELSNWVSVVRGSARCVCLTVLFGLALATAHAQFLDPSAQTAPNPSTDNSDPVTTPRYNDPTQATQTDRSTNTRDTTTDRNTTSNRPRNTDTNLQTQQDRDQQRLLSRKRTPAQPTEFQQIVFSDTGKRLPIFGAKIFDEAPSTFAPVENIPVTPDYVIGPGDELRLQLWGQVNQNGTYTVDRTGSIALPDVGTVHVAGIQFARLNDFLKSQFGRVYRNFDLNVNLGQLRSIQVFVVGQAVQPGSYTVGSMSTLLNALFASGGPLPQGSLRDIQLKRGNATITHFDLYDLLLRGDKSKDVALESGDVIFIPAAGPQIALIGSVAVPAIYEVRGESSFAQVVALAGGRTNGASGNDAQVERIFEHRERSIVKVDLSSPAAPMVQDGDIITIRPIVDRFRDAVTLRGNVANPGRMAWSAGMRISDLIPDKEALITRDYYQHRDQLGQTNADFLVQPPDQQLASSTTANSSSRRQSSSSSQESNQPQGLLGGGSDRQTGRDANTANQQDQQQQNQDQLQNQNQIQSNRNQNQNGGSNTLGAALTANGGSFPAKNDVILSAPDIDWNYAVIERQSKSDLTTSLLSFNLGKVILEKDPTQNIELLPGDVVTIFSKADIRVPSTQQTRIVKLEGEVVSAGVYSVLPGETLRQLLTRAGGLTPSAYLYASEFTRESTRRLQKQRLLDYADQLESQISSRTSASVSSAVSDRDASAAVAAGEDARAAVVRLRRIQPTGRIVLPITPDSQGLAAIPDLQLEDGDRFVVPQVPSSITVQGEVYSANAFVFEPGRHVSDYLHLAGGPDRIADRKREFVLRADGSVLSRQYVNFDKVPMVPGDTIVVPPQFERTAILRTLVNISQILTGFGVALAAINVLQ